MVFEKHQLQVLSHKLSIHLMRYSILQKKKSVTKIRSLSGVRAQRDQISSKAIYHKDMIGYTFLLMILTTGRCWAASFHIDQFDSTNAIPRKSATAFGTHLLALWIAFVVDIKLLCRLDSGQWLKYFYQTPTAYVYFLQIHITLLTLLSFSVSFCLRRLNWVHTQFHR